MGTPDDLLEGARLLLAIVSRTIEKFEKYSPEIIQKYTSYKEKYNSMGSEEERKTFLDTLPKNEREELVGLMLADDVVSKLSSITVVGMESKSPESKEEPKEDKTQEVN